MPSPAQQRPIGCPVAVEEEKVAVGAQQERLAVPVFERGEGAPLPLPLEHQAGGHHDGGGSAVLQHGRDERECHPGLAEADVVGDQVPGLATQPFRQEAETRLLAVAPGARLGCPALQTVRDSHPVHAHGAFPVAGARVGERSSPQARRTSSISST